MKVSLKWLKELIDTNLNTRDLVSKLTDLGLECSSSEIGPSFSKVVIGKVESVSKHTNSDHLSICKVTGPFYQFFHHQINGSEDVGLLDLQIHRC